MTEFDNSSSTDASVDDAIYDDTRTVSMEDDKPTFAKSRIQEELVLGLIRQAEALGSPSLDLCNKGLINIPEDLLGLHHLESLYLEGNALTYLPENMFNCLPNLQWLDLRGNQLRALPPILPGQLSKLRNLLLEGNSLTNLPPELGLVRTLNGLNIRRNPMAFPPQDIIEKGTQEILRYLREVLDTKSAAVLDGIEISNLTINEGKGDALQSAVPLYQSDEEDWQNYTDLRQRRHTLSGSSQTSTSSEHSGLTGPVLQPMELHQPASYSEIRAQHMDKLKKTGADGKTVLRRKSNSKSQSAKSIRGYPSLPTDAYVNFKLAEERRIAKDKELKMKQEAILQRRRDEESLKGWRDEAKKKQYKKHVERLQNGKIDFEEPAKQAPFGIEEENLRMLTKEQKIKEEVRATHEKMKKRPLTPGEKMKLEEEKAIRIRELERRIKAHTLQMAERRRKPKGNPQEEMMLAKRELEVAEDLQKELSHSRRQMEYRFRAFTGDIVEPKRSTKT